MGPIRNFALDYLLSNLFFIELANKEFDFKNNMVDDKSESNEFLFSLLQNISVSYVSYGCS